MITTIRAPPGRTGRARLELFVDLVPLNEPIPAHPGERSGGRLWYLRSFTTSRFEVDFPRLVVGDRPVPMRVAYWGRWADSTGGVGPFSQTCVSPLEQSEYALPEGACGGAGGTFVETRALPAAVAGALPAKRPALLPEAVAGALPGGMFIERAPNRGAEAGYPRVSMAKS